MRFSLLTYNVLFNKAYKQLDILIEKHQPDVICLQEVETSENNLKRLENLGYKLADYSNSFIKFGKVFGISTFYNPRRFLFVDSKSLNLSRTIIEILIMIIGLLRGRNEPRTVLKTDFIYKPLKKRLSIINTHLTVMVTNAGRIKQIRKIFEGITRKEIPLIIAGDFNYLPYGRASLERLAHKYELSEATRNINYTIKYSPDGNKEKYSFFERTMAKVFRKFFSDRLKIDYIFYKNLKLGKTKRINVEYSNHYPIIAYFNL